MDKFHHSGTIRLVKTMTNEDSTEPDNFSIPSLLKRIRLLELRVSVLMDAVERIEGEC